MLEESKYIPSTEVKQLSAWRKQAVIKFIEKQRRKKGIPVLKLILFPNIGVKLNCKSLAERFRNVLPEKIFSNNTPYVKNRWRR